MGNRGMKQFFAILAVWAAAQFCAVTISAQDVQSVVSVDSVVVRGARERRSVPTQSLDGQSLAALSAGSVAEAARFFSGVQIKDYGGIGGLKTVDVHGLGSGHVGVFYDGIAVGNAQNGVVDLGRFSLDNVEAVSLSLSGEGAGAGILASARELASSNSLSLRSHRPVFGAGERSKVRAALKTGSFATVNPSVVWERRLGARVNGSLSAEGLYSSGRYRFRYARRGGWDTVGVRTNGDIRLARVEASLFGDLGRGGGGGGGGGEWDAKAWFYASERGYPGPVIKRAEGASASVDDRQRDLSTFVQSSVRQRFSSYYALRAQAKVALEDTRYNERTWRQTEAYFSATNLFTLRAWWTATLGADVEHNALAGGSGDPSRLTVLGAASTAVGLRRWDVRANVLWTFSRDGGADAAPRRSIFSPAVSAAWRVGGGVSVRATYKRSFRLPTFNELYYNDLGNRALRPEFATQWSAGVRFRNPWLSATVDMYINKVHDKIVATPTGNQFSWTMLNLGRVEIRGVDAVVESRFPTRFSVRAAYTFQDASRGDVVPYLPKHSGSLMVSAELGNWTATWSAILTGERYRLGSQTIANVLGAWQTHDFGISREVSLPGDDSPTAKFTAQINNVFNRRYEVVRWYPMPGTNVKLIVTIML